MFVVALTKVLVLQSKLIPMGGAKHMYQIQMVDSNILTKKVESESKSQFDTGGSADRNGAVYRIIHAPADSAYHADELVLLSPGDYTALYFNGELLTSITESDIIGKITEGKE